MPDGGVTAALIISSIATTAVSVKAQKDAAARERRALDRLSSNPFGDGADLLSPAPSAEEAAMASRALDDSRATRDDLIIRPLEDTTKTGLAIR